MAESAHTPTSWLCRRWGGGGAGQLDTAAAGLIKGDSRPEGERQASAERSRLAAEQPRDADMDPSLLLFFLLLGHMAHVATAIDCSRVRCARPLCADPVTPPGQCCPSCDKSDCKLRGCVNILGTGEVRWQPDPCTTCFCSNGKTVCLAIACQSLRPADCFGRPVTTRPWQCCPSCDFGIPDNRCRTIPQSQRNLTVTASNQRGPAPTSCSRSVRVHGCDKPGIRIHSKTFRCSPWVGKRIVRFGRRCPLSVGFYRDVVRCKAIRDPNIVVGCDFFA